MTQEEKKAYMKEYNKRYYSSNKMKLSEKHKKYRNTPIGRANNLMASYRYTDKRDKYIETVDFDAEWLVNNILSKPCAHCGKTGWDVIGCNRLDNTKGHTKDNVEPCCKECNSKLGLEYQWKK
jgi:hypothetical protein